MVISLLNDYRRSLLSRGQNQGEARLNQTAKITDISFKDSTNYVPVIIDGNEVYARFIIDTDFSVTTGLSNYRLKFKNNVHYPNGTYVSIKNRTTGEYEDWIIINTSDNRTLPKAYIIKCTYTLSWINKSREIINKKCCIRTYTDNSTGISTSGDINTLSGNMVIWIPTDDNVDEIDYDQRFLIGYSKKRAQAYKTIKFNDTTIPSITIITFKKVESSNDDNKELSIANYYKYYNEDGSVIGEQIIPESNIENDIYSISIDGDSNMYTYTEGEYKITLLKNGLSHIDDVNISIDDNGIITYEISDNIVKIKSLGKRGKFTINTTFNNASTSKDILIKNLV